jgi:hypothetical protein
MQLHVVPRRDAAPQDLPPRPVRWRAGLLGPAAPEHEHAVASCVVGDTLCRARLADAGLAGKHDDAAGAAARDCQRRIERGQVLRAADELARFAKGRH